MTPQAWTRLFLTSFMAVQDSAKDWKLGQALEMPIA
jgi:hypothetical protein